MSLRQEVLPKFVPEGCGSFLYVPDLTMWYDWHARRGTLPAPWAGASLPDIARAMSAPAWVVAKPWQSVQSGVRVSSTESGGERIVRYETRKGALQARWALGPDSDWWQTEYPVKDRTDLPAAVEVVAARSYEMDAESPGDR